MPRRRKTRLASPWTTRDVVRMARELAPDLPNFLLPALVHRMLAGRSMDVEGLARQVIAALFGGGTVDKKQLGVKRQREAREELREIVQTVELVERLREELRPLQGKSYRSDDNALKAYGEALHGASVPERHARVLLKAYTRGLPVRSIANPAFRVAATAMGQEQDYTRKIFHGFPRLRKALEKAETLARPVWFIRECKRAFHELPRSQDRLVSLRMIRALQQAARRHGRVSAQQAAFSRRYGLHSPEEPR